MYRQHFGLNIAPLGKDLTELWDDGALRRLTSALNTHRYWCLYLAETDFDRTDLYRSLALALGIDPAYRRAQLRRDIKARIQELVDGKNLLPLWIIDEAQNLPAEFFRDFPALCARNGPRLVA